MWFVVEANKLLYWSTIKTVLLWIFEATPSQPRCSQWPTREKVSPRMFVEYAKECWNVLVQCWSEWNEARAYHENQNSNASISLKFHHHLPPPPQHLKIALFNTFPKGAKLCWNAPPKCWIWWSLFFLANIRPCGTLFVGYLVAKVKFLPFDSTILNPTRPNSGGVQILHLRHEEQQNAWGACMGGCWNDQFFKI